MTTMTKQGSVVMQGSGYTMNVLGHTVTVMLDKRVTNGDGYVFEVLSPPGAGIPPHVHEHEDEYIYLVEGQYEIFLDGEMIEAQTGAMLHFPRHVPHGFHNTGDTPGKTVWTVTPGRNFEPFFTELGDLPTDAPPDMEKVAAIFERYGIHILPPPGL